MRRYVVSVRPVAATILPCYGRTREAVRNAGIKLRNWNVGAVSMTLESARINGVRGVIDAEGVRGVRDAEGVRGVRDAESVRDSRVPDGRRR